MAKNNCIHPEIDGVQLEKDLNPFDSSFTLSWPQTIKVVLLGSILGPIRILLIVLTLLCGYISGQLFAQKKRNAEEDYEPHNQFSRRVQATTRFLLRIIVFISGFYWVNFKGQLASAEEAPIVVVAPHSSWFDASVFSFLGLKSIVARSESENHWMTGPLFRIFKPIAVTRTSKDSRLKTSETILRRAKSGRWPATGIFPEGTCSNGKCLISFKIGAFSPGVPVQPILIRYKNTTDYLSWSFQGTNLSKSVFVLFGQFVSFMEIEALPVYNPSEKEKEDPYLYANNVRQYMADHLGVPVSDHSYEDGLLCILATELGLPADVGLLGFETIKGKMGCPDGIDADRIEQGIPSEDLFRFSLSSMKTQLKQFAQMNMSKDGYLNKSELAKFYHLPQNSPHLDKLYAVFDKESTGKVDFKSFLMGRYQLICDNNHNSITDKTFIGLDDAHSSSLNLDDFLKMCQNNNAEIDTTLATSLFNEFNNTESMLLKIDSYREMVTTYPEFGFLISNHHR